MKISKITKLLPIALALSLTVGSVYAGNVISNDTKKQASVEYQLNLADYVKITETDGVTDVTGYYSTDYAALNLNNALSANFQVITNAARTIKLSSKSYAKDQPSALYGYNDSNKSFHLVFVNTTPAKGIDGKAVTVPSTSVTNITSAEPGSATLANSPNAFALKFTPSQTVQTIHNGVDNEGNSTDGGDAGAVTGVLDDTGITFTIPNGVTTLYYTSGTQALADTFNTRDTAGLYKADLYLDDIAPL